MQQERTIKVQGPFRLATALNVLLRFDEKKREPDQLTRISFSMEVPGGSVEVVLSQEKPGTDLNLKVLGDDVTNTNTDYIQTVVTRMFSLQVDPTPFFIQAANDFQLKSALQAYPDLRPVLYPTPFEGAVRLLIGRGLMPDQSSMMIRNLREVCGIIPSGRPYAKPAFPGKFTLLAVPDRLIEITGIPREKIRAIRNFASAMVGDPDILEHLHTVADPYKALNNLKVLPHIGKRTAEHMLLTAYGYQDLLTDDTRLYHAIKRFYCLPELPDEENVARLAQPYIPWRSWWMYLLKVADRAVVIV